MAVEKPGKKSRKVMYDRIHPYFDASHLMTDCTVVLLFKHSPTKV